MTNGKLKITVDKAFDLQGDAIPENLFCLFEFDGKGLATESNPVRSGTSVRWNEEAEFDIKKTANLRVQVCTKEGKGKLDVKTTRNFVQRNVFLGSQTVWKSKIRGLF